MHQLPCGLYFSCHTGKPKRNCLLLKNRLTECHALTQQPSPEVPALVALGTQERIVDVGPIHARMTVWPRGTLDIYQGCEHEVLMERASARDNFFESATKLFHKNR